MNVQGLIMMLAVGAIAGWLAGTVMKGRGFGLIGNIAVGVVGALVGGYVLGNVLGVAIGGAAMGGWLAGILNAFIGSAVVLFVIGMVKKKA